jgi:hypothetical protein
MDILWGTFEHCSYWPSHFPCQIQITHMQTQNITYCYNKQEIIIKVIHTLQDKRPIGI